MHFRSQCLTESIELQKHLIKAEKSLFLLNPISTALRVKLEIYSLQLAIAIDTGNAGEAARLAIEIENTIEKQKKLDKAQNALIDAANTYAKIRMVMIAGQMNYKSYKDSDRWSYFLTSLRAIYPEKIPELAVKPDTTFGWGPNYGLTDDYKTRQMVAFNWHLLFSSNDKAQKLVDTKNYFALSCGATAQKGDSWTVEIRKDKF